MRESWETVLETDFGRGRQRPERRTKKKSESASATGKGKPLDGFVRQFSETTREIPDLKFE